MAEMKTLTINGEQFTLPFAPSGFGLGETPGRYCSDCHAEMSGGLYYVNANTANKPDGVTVGTLLVQSVQAPDGIDYYLTLKNGANVAQCYYSSFAGAWQPWEWFNPPMLLGVAYRTTERHNGKAVYRALITFGALPDTASKTIAIAGGAAVTLISSSLELSDGCVINGYGKDRNVSANYGIYVDNSKYNLRVTTEANFSSLTANALVAYTLD